MSQADTRTLRIVVTGDSADGRRAVRDTGNEVEAVEKKTGKLSQAFQDLGPTVIAGIAGMGIIGGFQKTIGAATDLNETVSKTKTIFAEGYPVIEKWAKNAETSMGMSTKAALDGASTFANFFKQVGLGGPKVAEMSKRFVELSTDFASFHNAQPAEVMDALSAATRGEYDALQKFVPTANAAAVETAALAASGKKAAKELTLADKATGLYALVLKDGGAAIGDFGRTSDGAANQQRILTAKIEEQGAAIGNVLLPAYTGLLSTVNSVGPMYAAAGLASLVFGRQLSAGATAASGGMQNYLTNVRESARQTQQAGGKFGGLRTVMTGVGGAARAAGGAIRGMTALVGGPLGIAVAAATIGIGWLVGKHQDAKQETAKHAESVAAFTETLRLQNGVIDESIRQGAAKLLSDSGVLKGAEAIGLSTKEVTDAFIKGSGAMDQLLPRIDTYIEAQRAMIVTNRANGMSIIESADKFDKQEEAADKLRKQIEGVSSAMKKDADNQRIMANASKTVTGSWIEQGAAAVGLNEPSKKLAVIMYDMSKNLGSSAKKAGDLKAAWDELTGAQQSQEEAMIAYERTADEYRAGLSEEEKKLQAAKNALKGKTGAERQAAQAAVKAAEADVKASKALDARTEAGRKAREAIHKVAKASRDQMQADIASGVPAARALEAHRKRITAHEREAIKAGHSKTAVKKLFELYGKPPDDVTLSIKTANDKETSAKLWEKLKYQTALKLGTNPAAAERHLNKMRAGGGKIDGPGTTTSDEAGVYRGYAVSKKEWVIQAESTGKYGDAAMEDLNQGRIPRELLQNWRSVSQDRRAGGGPVWNRRTSDSYPFPINLGGMWVPTKEEAEKAVGGGWGNGSVMGYQNQVKWARSRFPGIGVTSTFRPGSRTLSGNASYHSRGRAVDFEPHRGLAMAIKSTFGKNIKELITPWRDMMIHNGKPHKYSGAVERQHGVGGAGNDHVHWAMDKGGVLPPKSTTTITNATRENEYALTRTQLKEVAGVNIENLNVTVTGNISDAEARRIALQIRTELDRVAGRNGGRSGLPKR